MKLCKGDLVSICLISFAYFLVASYNLGSQYSPTTYVSVSEDDIIVQFDSQKLVSSIYLLTSTIQGKIMASVSSYVNGEWILLNDLNDDGYYRWTGVDVNIITDQIKLHFYDGGILYEFVALDDNKERLNIRSISFMDKVGDLSKLIDEQSYFQYPVGFESEMYFDEVYFVRAATEYLKHEVPSEWTHPPLGKLIISSGIWLFSYSPFSWRLFGVIFAALMTPIMYLIGYELFETRFAAVASAILFSLDFMRFTMSRIGTTDTFLVFFLLASTFFFYLNLKGISNRSRFNFKYLALGIVFFFCAFSVKWTAAFSFVGEITILLIVVFRDAIRNKIQLASSLRAYFKQFITLTYMMIVGSGVYFLTFLPNVIIGYSISDVIAAQWNMFNFHSGLVSSHPYASGWFTWPLILRPILFSYTALPTGYISSITAMGNPLIWWGGLSAMILSLYKGFRYRELPSMFIGILYVSQVTLFAFIPRELFIYHYYPATPLLVLAIVAIMNQYWKGSNEKKVITLFFIASFVLFLSFYPIISGMYVPDSYIKYLRWFKGWSF